MSIEKKKQFNLRMRKESDSKSSELAKMAIDAISGNVSKKGSGIANEPKVNLHAQEAELTKRFEDKFKVYEEQISELRSKQEARSQREVQTSEKLISKLDELTAAAIEKFELTASEAAVKTNSKFEQAISQIASESKKKSR